MVNTIGIQHWNDLEDDVISKNLCRRIVANEKIYSTCNNAENKKLIEIIHLYHQ